MYSAVGKRRLLPAAERQTEWNRAVTNLRKACEMPSKINVGSGSVTPMVLTKLNTCGTRYNSKNKIAAPTTTSTNAG